jgi:Holliday junction resolvase
VTVAPAAGRRRGYAAERGLVLELEKRGWWATRTPASGRRGGFDIVAARAGRLVFFEVKTRGEGARIYLERWRWEGVLEEAARAGAEAYLALRVPLDESGVKWWLRPLADPDSVGQGSVLFKPPSEERGKWVRLEEVVS